MSDALRREIIRAAQQMNALGLNHGTSGNVSARTREGFLVTPTGMSYDALEPADIVAMAMDGRHAGARQPSSEWRFHRDILEARPEAMAVVHAHPMDATALSCVRKAIPAFHYMVAVAGGDSIRCAPYAAPGSAELSRLAVAALEGRQACLLANHGLIALGPTLDRALEVAAQVEVLAGQYIRALQAGEPVLLSAAEMAEVLEIFKTYGKQPDRGPRVRKKRAVFRSGRGRAASNTTA